MFDNIGKKIKTLAQVICVLGIIASAIGGIILWITGGGLGFVISLVAIPISAVVSWVGSFGLYGFGQLIENTDILVAQNEKKSKESNNSERRDGVVIGEKYVEKEKRQMSGKETFGNKSYIKKSALPTESHACADDDEFVDLYCPECGELLSFTKGYVRQNPLIVCPMCDTKINSYGLNM